MNRWLSEWLVVVAVSAASCSSEPKRVLKPSEPMRVEVTDAATGATSGQDDIVADSSDEWVVLAVSSHEPVARVFRLREIGLCDIFKQLPPGVTWQILRD